MAGSRFWLASIVALAFAGPMVAAQDAAPVAADVIDLTTDRADRMTVPVSIGGSGPFQFVVDTGAERTVISRELAVKLGLGAGRTATMHSMSGVDSVATVVIPMLKVSSNQVSDIHAPALARVNLGAVGMLGIDSLQTQRVLLDFKAGTMTVSPATKREERRDPDVIVVTARRRFGQLILVDASANGEKVNVIVDTGAQMSVGNSALRRKLGRRLDRLGTVTMTSVTGDTVLAEAGAIDKIKIGGVDLNNIPVAFADAHPFKKLGLDKKPALLLGMDALRLFDRVSVDFASKKVRFLMPDGAGRDGDTRLAVNALRTAG